MNAVAHASKLASLSEAAALIADGSSVAFGGSLLHRAPSAITRELARQGRRDLTFIKPSAAYDVDLLAAAGCLSTVYAGIVSMEALGLAPNYRRAVEEGRITLKEHTWISLAAGLRAAAFGVPFQPVAGMHGSDLPAASGLQSIADPYTGEEVYVVPSLRPDWAVLHVHEADALGNARIYGSVFWDRIMSRAARGVILSAERIVPTDELIRQPELTVVPSMLVRAVVEAPAGSRPCSCSPEYNVDWAGVEAYLTAARDRASLDAYLSCTDEALSPRRPTVLHPQRERPAPAPGQPVSACRSPY